MLVQERQRNVGGFEVEETQGCQESRADKVLFTSQAVRQAAACMYLGTCRHIWAAYRQTQEHTKTNALASWR